MVAVGKITLNPARWCASTRSSWFQMKYETSEGFWNPLPCRRTISKVRGESSWFRTQSSCWWCYNLISSNDHGMLYCLAAPPHRSFPQKILPDNSAQEFEPVIWKSVPGIWAPVRISRGCSLNKLEQHSNKIKNVAETGRLRRYWTQPRSGSFSHTDQRQAVSSSYTG